jgi:uncharacterized protein YukE
MADLEVDLGLLERTAGSLSMLIEEFDNCSKIVNSAQASVGDPALVAALDSFAGNWTAHREDLLSSMQAVLQDGDGKPQGIYRNRRQPRPRHPARRHAVTTRPPDFEPLAGTDPVPADTDEIAALGKRYTDTAAEIESQARNLRRLAANTTGGWVGKAGQAFQSRAADLATRISPAQERYAVAGQALSSCAQPMYDAQQEAYAAVWQAKDAQQQLAASAPVPLPVPGGPPPTAEETAAATQRRLAYDDATTTLASARRSFDGAVQDYQTAAARAAASINTEISTDPLKDSWWDRNFGWISDAFEVIAIVVTVLAVIALVLIIPGAAVLIAGFLTDALALLPGTLAVSAGTLTSVGAGAGIAATVGTAASAVFDGTAAATGKESWTAFEIDLASLAMVGFGEGASALAKGLAEGAEDTTKTVGAARAGRGFMSANGLPGVLFSVASRSSAVAKVLDWVGQADKLEGATKAAADARTAVAAAVKEAEPSRLAVAWAMNAEVAEGDAQLAALDTKVPGVLRIIVPKVLGRALMVTEGGGQWATFTGGNAYNVFQWTSGDDSQAGIDQTITQFRQTMSQVP